MPTALFNSETARKYAAKSAEVRRANARAREDGTDKPDEQPADGPHNAKPDFIAASLARVRKQLNKLYRMMEEEESAQSIDRLASAIARLSELERQLAGRPLPGSFRPTQRTQRSHSAGQSAAPLDVDE